MIELNNIQPQVKLKVLLIGESCIDRYNFCKVLKLSQEVPVPVVRHTRYYEKSGMAANVYNNLKALDILPDFITCTEQIYKTRIVEEKSHYQLLRIDNDPEVALWNQEDLNLMQYDAIIISDYNKGFLNYTAIVKIIAESRGLIFLDTKKTDLIQFYSNRVYVKINDLEYEQAISMPKHLIVTRGSKQILYFFNRQQPYPPFPVKQQEVIDVCGAGDTFLAAFSAMFLWSNNIEQAINFASKAASITVQHLGNYSPTRQEIDLA